MPTAAGEAKHEEIGEGDASDDARAGERDGGEEDIHVNIKKSIYVYTYIYIYRERERCNIYIYICIVCTYVYIYICLVI